MKVGIPRGLYYYHYKDLWLSFFKRLGIDVLVMGDDWKGSDKFESLKQFCDVVFLPKMEGLSSTKFRGHVEEYVKLMEEDE